MLIIEDLNKNSKEIWRDVVGYEGLYQVSSMGRVKSLECWLYNGHRYFLKREKILKPAEDLRHKARGYLRVSLFKDGKKKRFFVHRLVASAFIPNPENKPEVDHVNTIKTDNRLENLRWATSKENMNNPLTIACFLSGKNPHARSVINLDTNQIFDTLTKASLAFDRAVTSIHQAIRTGNKCAGHRWAYYEN